MISWQEKNNIKSGGRKNKRSRLKKQSLIVYHYKLFDDRPTAYLYLVYGGLSLAKEQFQLELKCKNLQIKVKLFKDFACHVNNHKFTTAG